MNRNARVAIGCSAAAAVCFGIVSCGDFCSGQMERGGVFAVLAAVQLAIAWQNLRLIRRA